jgi:predicted phage-related endonuclease
MSTQELEQKVRELRQMQAIVEEAQAEVEALKDAIKAAMGQREELRAGEYKITWKAVTTSRLDTAKLKKALPDVAAAFTTQSTTRRFIVA